VVDEIERQLGKPVICSNQAILWDCLRLAGIDDRLEGLGDLLRRF
jgi:maleate isomerase